MYHCLSILVAAVTLAYDEGHWKINKLLNGPVLVAAVIIYAVISRTTDM
jgi:hypothetical protein